MNKLKGHISDIKTSGDFSMVTVELMESIQLQVIVIETPATAEYLRSGHPVYALFKETEVILSPDSAPSVSIGNRIPCRIQNIEAGILLSRIELTSAAGPLTGILATTSLDRLKLSEDQPVTALIKFNEIMLSVK